PQLGGARQGRPQRGGRARAGRLAAAPGDRGAARGLALGAGPAAERPGARELDPVRDPHPPRGVARRGRGLPGRARVRGAPVPGRVAVRARLAPLALALATLGLTWFAARGLPEPAPAAALRTLALSGLAAA